MQIGDYQNRRTNLLRDSLRYQWFLVGLAAMVGTALGIGLVFLKPVTYSSSTTLILNPLPGNPYDPASSADTLEMVQTEAVAVTSENTAQAVIDELHLGGVSREQLRQQTTVDVPPNTQALQIAYASTSRSITVEVVNSIAQQFLAERKSIAKQWIAQTTTSLQRQIADTRGAYDAALKAKNQSLAAGYQADLVSFKSQLAAANALPTDPGRVLTPGLTPQESGQRHLITFAIAGLLLGALAGLAIALWRERRLDRVRSTGDLADYDFSAPVNVVTGPGIGGAVRQLRMRLAQQMNTHGVVGLVGVAPGTALQVSVAVARTLADAGVRVTLIDGTGTEARHFDPLGYDDKPGLADSLLDPMSILPTGHRISDQLRYLPAGRDPTAAVEQLVGTRPRTIVRAFAARSDVTIVACVATNQVEGEALARLTDGVVVVVELHRTSHFDLGVVLRSVAALDLPLLGVFVVPAARR